jgi:hypothetical protein
MGKSAEEKRRDAQWKAEKGQIERFRRLAPAMKTALREKGCDLPFYDMLDSFEDEFKKLAMWSKEQIPTIHEVYEVGIKDIGGPAQQPSLPADWQRIKLNCEEDIGRSYTAEDPNATLRGGVTWFRDANGGTHAVIEVLRSPPCQWLYKEHKYAFKLPILLHEIGHVKDSEQRINIDLDANKVDVIEAEVFAHIFALSECFQRAYYMSGTMWSDSLAGYKNATDYRGEVARRVIARFQRPTYKAWPDYDA